MTNVSENIDKLLAQMSDAATGESAGAKARMAFYAELEVPSATEEQAWRKAIAAAGSRKFPISTEDSLVMGGWDRAGLKAYPEQWVDRPDLLDWSRMSAYNDFKGCGLDDATCRQLLKIWEDYYTSPEVLAKLVAQSDPQQQHDLQQESKKPSTKGYVQIGGDFGDPWDSGGTWYNEATGTIIHHDELTEKEWAGVDEEDPRVDPMLTPKNYWDIAKALTAEKECAWEGVESEIRTAHAEVVKAGLKFTYYVTCVEPDEVIERDWAKHIASIKAGLDNGEELWSGMTPAEKIEALATHLGWHEFDYDANRATKAELSVILGIDL